MSQTTKPAAWRTVAIHEGLLAKNDHLADELRRRFREKATLVLNVLSSPGSGKTALLTRTLAEMRGKRRMGVIVGDLATENDARRLSESGAPVVQITTGDVCHLDAAMIARALEQIDLDGLEILFIENVGNLVCPSAFDLGESRRVALLSVTEGEDKPLKYPTLFRTAHLVLITKTDAAEAVGFDRAAALQNLRQAAPQAEILEVSARTGANMDAWYAWLENAHFASVEHGALR